MRPFKSKENNNIDLVAITAGTLTIYSGIIFSLGHEVHNGFYTLAWILLLYFNCYFLLNWFYLFVLSIGWKNRKYAFFVDLVGMILWKKRKFAKYFTSKSSNDNGKPLKSHHDRTPKRRVYRRKYHKSKMGVHLLERKKHHHKKLAIPHPQSTVGLL